MDKQFKKLIPSIYLHDCKAVKGLADYETVSEDPAALAAAYDNGFTDALMVFDLSGSDKEQEAHNDIIREICGRVRIPVIAAGRVTRSPTLNLRHSGPTSTTRPVDSWPRMAGYSLW